MNVRSMDKRRVDAYVQGMKLREGGNVVTLNARRKPENYEARREVNGEEQFRLDNVEYSSLEGLVLSNIILSKLIQRIQNPHINYNIYVQKGGFFVLGTYEHVEAYVKQWLSDSGFHDRKVQRNVERYVRCCVLVDFFFADRDPKPQGHEISLFWQYCFDTQQSKFYIVDNLPLDEYHQQRRFWFNTAIVMLTRCTNVFDVMNKSVIFDERGLPGVEGYRSCNYLCTSAARRAAIYAATVEDLENGDVWSEEGSNEAFFGHYRNYTHYMHKMMNWLNESEIVWAQRQEDRVSILPADPFVMIELFNEHLRWPRDGQFIRLQPNLAYIWVVHLATGTRTKFWMTFDDSREVFVPEDVDAQGDLRSICHMQKQFNANLMWFHLS